MEGPGFEEFRRAAERACRYEADAAPRNWLGIKPRPLHESLPGPLWQMIMKLAWEIFRLFVPDLPVKGQFLGIWEVTHHRFYAVREELENREKAT